MFYGYIIQLFRQIISVQPLIMSIQVPFGLKVIHRERDENHTLFAIRYFSCDHGFC